MTIKFDSFFATMQHVRLDLVFEPAAVFSEFVSQLDLCGVRTENICDCIVVRTNCKQWTPPDGVVIPKSLIGGVIVFDAGYGLDIIAATFPGMYYKIDETDTDVTAAFSRIDILRDQMATTLRTVDLHFDIPKPGMPVAEPVTHPLAFCSFDGHSSATESVTNVCGRISDEASRFVDNLFITAFYDHCIYDAKEFGVDYKLVVSSDKPWEFSKNVAIPTSLTVVKLVYESSEIGVFNRIRNDIAVAFPNMKSCHHVDGTRIEVVLSSNGLE